MQREAKRRPNGSEKEVARWKREGGPREGSLSWAGLPFRLEGKEAKRKSRKGDPHVSEKEAQGRDMGLSRRRHLWPRGSIRDRDPKCTNTLLVVFVKARDTRHTGIGYP